jgi:hypothetical protein
MRRAVILFLLIASAAAHADSIWKVFPGKDGRWSVWFPGLPTEEKVSTPTQVGTLEATIWMVSLAANVAYAVSETEYPKDIPKKEIEARLDGARDGMVNKVKGKLVSEGKITLTGGYPGREAVVRIGDATLLVRIYLVNRRMYQLMVLAGEGAEPATFFDSFKVLKP